MSLLKLWLADLKSKFPQNIHVSDVSKCDQDILPQISVSYMEDYLRSSMHRVELFYNDIVIAVYEPEEMFSLESKKLAVFGKSMYLTEHGDMDYVSSLHSILNLNIPYMFCADGSVKASNLEYSNVCVQDHGKHIVIGTPLHKRHDLSNLHLSYLNDYLVPSLMWHGYYVTTILCGDRDDFKGIKSVFDPRYNMFVEVPNNLGAKKNHIYKIAKSVKADTLVWIDSDDFFHPSTVLSLIELAERNGYWSAIEPFAFFDTFSGEYIHFEGYAAGHQLSDWGMGSGRVFTQYLMHVLKDSPFVEANKSIDNAMKPILAALNVPPEQRLLREFEHLPIGVKTEENIWGVSTYKGIVLDEFAEKVAWLPSPIQKRIYEMYTHRKEQVQKT